MEYNAEHLRDNAWLVTEINDEGNTKRHNVFCRKDKNTKETAISLIKDYVVYTLPEEEENK
jgi:hypothetical protein